MSSNIVENLESIEQNPIRSNRRRTSDHPAWFLAPALAVLVVFFVIPTIYNFVYAFTDWSSYKSAINFVGFTNFQDLLANDQLVRSLVITLQYAILVAIFQNFFGLALALLLERDTKVNRFARAAFFIPVLMSALAVGYIFKALLRPDGGLNVLLSTLTGQDISFAWLSDMVWTLPIITLVHSWKWMGLTMLIYLAGLKTIGADVLEASKIDGAGWWATLRGIKIPLLGPAITFNVATSLLGSMSGFDIIQAMTAGGPAGSTELVNVFVFRTFGQGLYAQATTMSLLLFVMVTLIAFPVIIYLRRREAVL